MKPTKLDRQAARLLTKNIIELCDWREGISWFRRWRAKKQIYKAVLRDLVRWDLDLLLPSQTDTIQIVDAWFSDWRNDE